MMKKLLSLVFALCLIVSAFTLIACEPPEDVSPKEEQKQEESAADEGAKPDDLDEDDGCDGDEDVNYDDMDVPKKPVIYLYPTEDTLCSVRVELNGKFTCTYPDYGTDGWQNFIAAPDGTLTFPDGKEYYCLYWEGLLDIDLDLSHGACVRGEDTATYLEWALSEMGLTAREANEFIIYWLPQLQENAYNLISFQGEAYTDAAKLTVTPTPDSVLRVYMVAKPLTAPIDVEPQTFEPFERVGFAVVEWGGSIVE